MSIFGSIMHKIFSPSEAAPASTPSTTSDPGQQPNSAANAVSPPQASPVPAAAMASNTPAPQVDVEAVLTQMASQKDGGGNWRTSIVDLLKLLDLDSSLAARKELAGELSVHAGADGSAEENIALHQAVMQKLAENGGKVPDSLRH